MENESATNKWLSKSITGALGVSPDKTICIVAHQSEIKDGVLDGVLPKGLSASKHFRQDLNMNGHYWFYQPSRILLVQKGKDADDASVADVRKDYRKLGAIACAGLQAKKIDDVEIMVTQKICSSGFVGIFENSFYLSNYENSLKQRDAPKDEKKDDGDEDADNRGDRVQKKVSTYSITSEDIHAFYTDESNFQRINGQSTELARDLNNSRGSVGTPDWMEERVHEVVKGHDLVKEVRVLDAKQLQEQGMNLFWNVGKGADSQPRCVMVHYQGDASRPDEVDVAFIGKGVTYDTGGLNIKGTGYMELMYGDKGGSCAVIGALKGTLELKTKKNIIFACGFAENAIGAHCFKPGDILTSMKGLTVEIGNTDAEGRLVLADTFTYVQRNFKPKQIVDLATLTGACIVALGHETGGLFSNDDDLTEQLQAAAKSSFEALWHLPITDEHNNVILGKTGDINNAPTDRFGGASQAAAFLQRFVEKGVKWAHLDIAGPACETNPKAPICHDQTGFGASLLLHFLRKL